jgi:hypothetical protein
MRICSAAGIAESPLLYAVPFLLNLSNESISYHPKK